MSKGNRVSFDGLSVGDIVQVRTTRVVGKMTDEYMRLDDVQSGASVHVGRYQDYGTLHIDMVKKAKPPKPQAGASVAGNVLGDWWWKRGTLIRDFNGVVLTLHADGCWHSAESNLSYPFSDFRPDELVEILHVA